MLTFANTHTAMMAETLLKNRFKIMIMPTLREISAGCGISIKIEVCDINNVLKHLETAEFDAAQMEVYAIQYTDGTARISKYRN